MGLEARGWGFRSELTGALSAEKRAQRAERGEPRAVVWQ